MQQIFLELYNYGPAWRKCSENERTEFIKKVIESVNGITVTVHLIDSFRT